MMKSGGIGFCGLLTIVFITLKLTGHITWSWVWVLSPLWLVSAICLFLMCSVVSSVFLALIAAAAFQGRFR